MWDSLDLVSKADYKKRTESAKKDYLKKLAAYRESLGTGCPADSFSRAPYSSSTFTNEANGISHGHHTVKTFLDDSSQAKNLGNCLSHLSGQPVNTKPQDQSAGQTSGYPAKGSYTSFYRQASHPRLKMIEPRTISKLG